VHNEGAIKFVKFRVQWPSAAKMWGSDESRSASQLSPQDQTLICQVCGCWFSPNLAMTRESMRLRNVLEGFSKIFHLGAFVTKNLKIEWCQTGTSLQPRAHIAVRCCLLYVVQGPRSFLARHFFVNVQFWSYRASKFSYFRIFAYIFLHKMPKSTYLCPAYIQPRGCIAECFRLFHF